MDPTETKGIWLDTVEAQGLALELFGLEAEAQELPSYEDQNFLLTSSSGERLVLKLARVTEYRKRLEDQNAASELLAGAGIQAPVARRNSAGEGILVWKDRYENDRLARVVTWVSGRVMADVAPHTPALLEDLGGFLGRMDKALGSLELPSLQDKLAWDLLRAPEYRSLVGALEDPAREDQLHALFARFEEQSFGELLELRRAVIHNDPNDENLLLDESGDHVTGIIDFGDLMNTALISELAVAAAYACLGKPDPVAAVIPILRGYHAEYPLEEREVRLLGELLQIRLAVSLANCAHRSRQHPENEYLSVSSARAWDVLDLLADVDLRGLGDTFERARREVTPRVRP